MKMKVLRVEDILRHFHEPSCICLSADHSSEVYECYSSELVCGSLLVLHFALWARFSHSQKICFIALVLDDVTISSVKESGCSGGWRGDMPYKFVSVALYVCLIITVYFC